MKICAVTTWPPHRDGISLYSAQLYEHIGKNTEVKVLANIIDSPTSNEEAFDKGIHCRIIRCWRRGSVTYPFKIFRRILMEKPDIIHLQHGWLLYGDKFSSLLLPLLLILLRLTKRPLIVTMHTIIGEKPRLHENGVANFIARMLITFLMGSIVKLSSKIVVHNNLMKTALENLYSLRKDNWKIFVIPHGVREASRKPRNIRKNGGVKILSLGFLRKEKGIEYLIDAFKIFSINCPKTTLIIAGGKHAHDNDEGYIKLIKRRLPDAASKNIIFTEFVDDETLDRLIWESEIIILLSLGRHYIEASGSLARVAMYGKPLICSKVPKFEADLEDGKDCIMVESDNPKKLAEMLSLLTNDASLRENMGRNLKRKFKDRTWSNVAEQHIKIFKDSLRLASVEQKIHKGSSSD
ncbi:glycosyltransferase [Candidatus Bathyarchaeota archaeon]|nr:glycosyltransferase [Candidatus Bathyarchaeota archaeon]